jgi:gas vesicle protein
VYIGRLRWGSRPQIKRRDGSSRPRKPREQWLETKGLHPPIVEEQTYRLAAKILEENGHSPAPAGKISNPMAGIVKCEVCGAAIVYKPYSGRNSQTPASLLCSTQYCKNKSSYFYLVEEKLLKALQDWLSAYKAEWEGTRPESDKRNEQVKVKAIQDMLKNQAKRLQELTEQKNNLHDLVEKRVYTIEVFLERSQLVSRQIDEIQDAISQSEKELDVENKRMAARVDTIPKVEYVLEVYHQTESPAAKNALLKSILEKVTYRKDVGGRWSGAIDQFELVLFPKLPKNE